MRIRELLSQKNQVELQTTRPNLELIEAARILCSKNIGALPVVGDHQNIVGIISERDLVRSLVSDNVHIFNKTVEDIMTKSVITCQPDDIADDVYEVISEKNIRHIPVVENDKLSAMLSIRDFENSHRRMRMQSLTDTLTGVHNLRHFLNILDNEFNRYRRFRAPLSLATIKIDDFAQFNASKGHAASDSLLKKVTGILFEETRTYDSIGRIADDEFAIVFPNTEPKTANRACERLLWAVRGAASGANKGPAQFSVSIGLAFANHQNCDGMSIMKRADELAQSAAGSGGDSVVADQAPEAADVQVAPAAANGGAGVRASRF